MALSIRAGADGVDPNPRALEASVAVSGVTRPALLSPSVSRTISLLLASLSFRRFAAEAIAEPIAVPLRPSQFAGDQGSESASHGQA